jgi:hypothetical protein
MLCASERDKKFFLSFLLRAVVVAAGEGAVENNFMLRHDTHTHTEELLIFIAEHNSFLPHRRELLQLLANDDDKKD